MASAVLSPFTSTASSTIVRQKNDLHVYSPSTGPWLTAKENSDLIPGPFNRNGMSRYFHVIVGRNRLHSFYMLSLLIHRCHNESMSEP